MCRSFTYALAALASAAFSLTHARTNLLLSTQPMQDAAKEPVMISPSDAHRVLTHHLQVGSNALPDVRLHTAEHEDLWHHLPVDQAHYDASRLFEPEAPRRGNVMVILHGAVEDDGNSKLPSDLFPDSLTHTHSIPSHTSPSRESFDALAALYEKTANGVHKAWDGAKEGMVSSIERLRAELADIVGLANSEFIDLDALTSARILALDDVKHEFGAQSSTYREAKQQVKETLEHLVERVKDLAGAGVAVVHTSGADSHRRRAVPQYNVGTSSPLTTPVSSHASSPLYYGASPPPPPPGAAGSLSEAFDPLHAFRPVGHVTTMQGAAASVAGSTCPASEQELSNMTNHCNGHGVAAQSAKGGRLCWRCKCMRTTEQGVTRSWSGSACEKQDWAPEMLLFLGTALVLFVSILGSCALLYREGTHELPGTLSSVSIRT